MKQPQYCSSSEILDLIYDAGGEERFIEFAEKELGAFIVWDKDECAYTFYNAEVSG